MRFEEVVRQTLNNRQKVAKGIDEEVVKRHFDEMKVDEVMKKSEARPYKCSLPEILPEGEVSGRGSS